MVMQFAKVVILERNSEALRGNPYAPEADIYGFGINMAELAFADKAYFNVTKDPIRDNKLARKMVKEHRRPRRIEEQVNKFGVCAKCNNFKSNFNWCPSCDCAQLIKNFNNWSSENDKLDEFIRYTQSTAKSYLSYLEWIPYERFENIDKIGSGRLSDVYSAIWKDGERIDNYWDEENNHIHERSQPIPVALKCHRRIDNFGVMKILIRHHRCTNNAANNVRDFIRHYGVTKDPKTGDFIIITQYANDGSLKKFLHENKIKHGWQWKLNLFRYLAQDLSTMHNVGLAHQDVKNENVFIRDDWAYLSQLYWSVSKEALPQEEFIKVKAMDIYAFGILMAEIACEGLEFFNKAHDIPKPVLKLINSCIYKDFTKRPDINKILYILEKWCGNPQHNQFDDTF